MAKDIYIRKTYEPVQLGYLAGIIDGEGCIYIGNHSKNKETGAPYFQTVLKVTSTDKCLPLWLQCTFGGLIGEYTEKQTPKSSRRTAHFWQASGERLTHLCELVLPLVVIKEAEIEIMLRMRATYNGVTQLGKKGIQAHSKELLDLRKFLMDQLRSLHIRNHTYQRD